MTITTTTTTTTTNTRTQRRRRGVMDSYTVSPFFTFKDLVIVDDKGDVYMYPLWTVERVTITMRQSCVSLLTSSSFGIWICWSNIALYSYDYNQYT